MSAQPQALIIVPITIDGEAAHAMVDTGAPDVIVDRALALRHRLKLRPSHGLRAVGGTMLPIETTTMPSLAIGNARRDGDAVEVGDLGGFARGMGEDIQAIVGASFLAHYAIDLDFDGQRMRLRPSGAPPPAGEAAPLSFRQAGNRYLTQVAVGATQVDPVLIDTGDNNQFAVPQALWADLPPGHATDIGSIDVAGKARFADYRRLDGIRLGAATLDKVGTLLDPTGIDAPDHARLGLGLLRRFNLFLDPGAGRMVLSPRATPEPLSITMTGIQGPFTDTGQQVFHVMKNSPAAQAGLHDGDRICTVDGDRVQASWKGTTKAAWGWAPAGKRVSLGLCDGRTVALTLAEFY
jgi:hypothetical protein